MTTHKNRKSLVAASGVAVLVATLLGGCSSGGDVEAFCTDAGAIVDGSFVDDVDPENAEDVSAVYDTALERVDKVDPPKDIKEDWDLTAEAMHTFLGGLADLDPESDTYMDEMQKLGEDMDEDALQKASENIETYLADNCEA